MGRSTLTFSFSPLVARWYSSDHSDRKNKGSNPRGDRKIISIAIIIIMIIIIIIMIMQMIIMTVIIIIK